MRLLCIAGLGLTLIGMLHADSNPFASYERAIDDHLSRILERREAHQSPARLQAVPAEEAGIPGAGSIIASNAPLERKRADFPGALARLQTLRPVLERILQTEGLPRELVALVLVESGAQPNALSPRHARGLWQLMPDTARQYGLDVSAGRDQRVELEHSTRAAARYLRDLFHRFGDWPLALAAYNAGQEAVQRALDRSGAKTFWQLQATRRLPAETRNYVPAVLSAMRLLGPAPIQASPTGNTAVERWVFAAAEPSN